ncbi:MAG: hypothetical protein N2253_06480 [Bacteroidia bacterium]|nr:hypothetical protein [Bacteroidia bacterium]
MPLRLRESVEKGRQSYLGYIRWGLYVGGALAAVGLLTRCGWDTDTPFFPEKIGVYLRVDTHLYWLPEGGLPIYIHVPVRSISATPWGLAALSGNGQVLYLFQGGQRGPSLSIPLEESCGQVQAFFEKGVLCLACPSGLRIAQSPEKAFSPRWRVFFAPGGYTHVAAASSFIVAGGPQRVAAYEGQRFAEVGEMRLSGRLQKVWIEHPGGASGIWIDSTGRRNIFSYLHNARLFRWDSTTSVWLRQTSPYLKRSVGTEYLGSVALSVDSVLSPGGYGSVGSFSVDFVRGEIYFLRRDSVWRYQIEGSSEAKLIGVFSGAKEIEIVPIYRYGSAEVTIR